MATSTCPCPRQGLHAITPLTSLKDCTMGLGFSFGSRNRPDVAVFPISSADCSRACVGKKKRIWSATLRYEEIMESHGRQ